MIALQKLLESHSLESSDLAEGLYYENAACIMERGDEAEVNRLLRVIATNKRLLAHGLEPLGCSTAPTPQPCALVGKAGLSAEEYEAIRGEGGSIMGLSVKAPLYRRLVEQCSTKRARQVEGDEEACQRFIAKKMKALASAELLKLSLTGGCRAAPGTKLPECSGSQCGARCYTDSG